MNEERERGSVQSADKTHIFTHRYPMILRQSYRHEHLGIASPDLHGCQGRGRTVRDTKRNRLE